MKTTRHVLAACAALLVLLGAAPALANSTPVHWSGATATGAVVQGDCPLEVESELITFDIAMFPEQHYAAAEDFAAYTGSVTAEYGFFNPAGHAARSTLLFPFGTLPDYGPTSGVSTEQYGVFINGGAAEKVLRHTYFPRYSEFMLEDELALLHHGFYEDAFYSPSLPVTRYTFKEAGVDYEAYPAATAAFTALASKEHTRVMLENSSGGGPAEGGVLLTTWVEPGREYVVDILGKPPENGVVWAFYENGGCQTEIEGSMQLLSSQTLTLKEFLMLGYNNGSGILEQDWFNAKVAAMKRHEWNDVAIAFDEFGHDISAQLMRWYEYEISLEPGERLQNTVTAPLYPAIDAAYEPPVYTYGYLLSPAKSWAGFGSLEVVLNTPFYMVESSLGGFEKTGTGYSLVLDGLPSGELAFSLCASQQPSRASRGGYGWLPLAAVVAALLLALAAAAIAFAVRRKRRGSQG